MGLTGYISPPCNYLGGTAWGPDSLGLVRFSGDSREGQVPLYSVPFGPRGFWESQTLMYPNFRKNSQGHSLSTRTSPRIPSRSPQVRVHPSFPQPSPLPPAPPPRALPAPSPARPGRCFSPAEPSPTRVAACSRELIPAGRGRRLPAPAARLSKRATPPPQHPVPSSRPARPAAQEPLPPSARRGCPRPPADWPAQLRPGAPPWPPPLPPGSRTRSDRPLHLS